MLWARNLPVFDAGGKLMVKFLDIFHRDNFCISLGALPNSSGHHKKWA